ncbi:hypothetical protein HDE_02144 [Halotydeus destructor]|nr:hypothetical protein HDE_02144 [Halotydeus destructor]
MKYNALIVLLFLAVAVCGQELETMEEPAMPAPGGPSSPSPPSGGGKKGGKGDWKKRIEEWCAAPPSESEEARFKCKTEAISKISVGDKPLNEIDAECKKKFSVDVATDAAGSKKSACDVKQRKQKRDVMRCVMDSCKASDEAKKACKEGWKAIMGCWKPKKA